MRVSMTLITAALLATGAVSTSVSSPVTFTDAGAAMLGGFNGNSRSGSFADIDNDGDLDLLVQGAVAARTLWRNNIIGLGTSDFTDVTASQGPSAPDTTGWSAAWGDYDGDGDVDVFLGETNSSGATGDLFRNHLVESGTASFEDVSASMGLIPDPGFHQNVAWNDIDTDGDLDLIIAMEGPEPHEIYIQESNGSFTQSGSAVGIQVPYDGVNHGKSYGMAIGDTDGDGDSEIYLSTCIVTGSIRNNFFDNQLVEMGGTLSFTDIADSNGTQFFPNSYGAEFHDFDDDGDLDLFMIGADQQPSKIFVNVGGILFTDVDAVTGQPLLSNTGGDLNGGRAIDFDNDGDLDLHFHDHRAFGGRDSARRLYRDDGAWAFTDVTATTGLSASNEGGYDSAWGDVDLDGDLDLFCANDATAPERLFLSDASTNGNSWLFVRLLGPPGNTTAIGAQVFVTVNDGSLAGKTLRRDANANAGAFNQSATPVHFGLADATSVDLQIIWPDGTVGNLLSQTVNQYLTVDISTVPVGLSLLGTGS